MSFCVSRHSSYTVKFEGGGNALLISARFWLKTDDDSLSLMMTRLTISVLSILATIGYGYRWSKSKAQLFLPYKH